MKVPYNWLKEFVSIESYSPEEIAKILLSIGFEVSEITEVKSEFKNIVTAEIRSITPHPNADKLTICNVTDGKKEYSIVCGAKNIKQNDIVPLALPGAKLSDGTEIKAMSIRKVKSEGMLCSSKELGIDDDHTGIMILPRETPVGKDLSAILDELEDFIFDIEIHPNRPDCLSIIGIARELSAKLKLNLKYPEIYLTDKSEETLSVEISEPSLCQRYIACLLKDIEVKQSPIKIKNRLKKCGLRPINNIVDITNYVLLEFGHPLHAFDFEKLDGKKIIVRKARDKEKVLGLDGKNYELDENMLVISDSKNAQAIAGVIGSETSGITDSTKEILLESAIFNPKNIRSTRQKLNITTESSYRFERGTTWDNCDTASKRAICLLIEYADAKFITRNDVYPEKIKKETISLRIDRLNSILSTELDRKEIAEILTSLGMEIEPRQENFLVRPPTHRVDINEEIDLIEEVARIKGYENIPIKVCATSIPLYNIPQPVLDLQNIVRNFLLSQGFYETINYGFNKEDDYLKLKSHSFEKVPVEIENPLSKETQFLRISLLPELLKNLITNIDSQFEDIKLFEVGKVFFVENGNTKETNMLGIIATGNITHHHWKYKSQKIDFSYFNGLIQTLLKNELNLSYDMSKNPSKLFNPIESAICSYLDGTIIASYGLLNSEFHPKIKKDIYFAEINLEFIAEKYSYKKTFVPYPLFPKSKRDISIIVPENISYSEITREISKCETDELKITPELFDVYCGKNIPEKTKSLGIALNFQHTKKTLTDEEVNKKTEEILSKLSKFGISLRKF